MSGLWCDISRKGLVVMVCTEFADFAKQYQDHELENHNYFGFDLGAGSDERGFYHVHCKTFQARNKDEVYLYDLRKHIITIAKVVNVTGVTSCRSNYWDVNCQLYLRGY